MGPTVYVLKHLVSLRALMLSKLKFYVSSGQWFETAEIGR